MKGIGTLANIPFYGLSSASNAQLLEKARAAGFASVFATHEGTKPVIDALEGRVSQQDSESLAGEELVVSRDPSLNRLREITRDIITTAAQLKPRIGEYGEGGPELFGYIETSSVANRKKLNGVEDFSLHDKELRHDFRNMIGSVTGCSPRASLSPITRPPWTPAPAQIDE